MLGYLFLNIIGSSKITIFPRAMHSKNCLLLGTDNVQGQKNKKLREILKPMAKHGKSKPKQPRVNYVSQVKIVELIIIIIN